MIRESLKRLKHEKSYRLVPVNGKTAKIFSLSYTAQYVDI